ncbi:MAG: hypothetical protein HC830_10115 [Bacteroidetes bacterium]|nr:hypothetical protein [Bacteroidota bacterium]
MNLKKTVIGVCLGAQMIANALGCKVYPGDQKEIGWFKINMYEDTVLGIEAKMPMVFHWHGETFDLPDKARLLASTGVCANQIFAVGNHVIGMQCHLEMTPASIEGMLKNCSGELQDAPYIQTEKEIREGTLKYASLANQVLFELLNALKTNQ